MADGEDILVRSSERDLELGKETGGVGLEGRRVLRTSRSARLQVRLKEGR